MSSSFESGYGDSVKEQVIEHVKPLKATEIAKDPAEATKTRSELILEEYDDDGNYIGLMSEPEESADSEESESEEDKI